MHLTVATLDRTRGLRPAVGRLAAASIALFAVASQATGQTTDAPAAPGRSADFGVRVGGGYSDNILRAPVDPESGSYSTVGIDATVDHGSRRLTADVRSDVEWRMYSDDSIDSQPYGNASADVEIAAVQNRFYWILTDDFGQVRSNAYTVDGPDNRQSINVLSTGPRLDIPFGGRTYLQLEGQYSNRRYSDSGELDNNVVRVEAGLYRRVSATTQVGLAVDSWDYAGSESSASSVDTAYLSYTRQLADGAVSLSLGQTRTGAGVDEHTTPFVDINWSNGIGNRSNLSIFLQNGFVDTGMGFALGNPRSLSQDGGGEASLDSTSDTLLSADRYRRSLFGTSYKISGERMSFSLGLRRMESAYETDVGLDNDLTGLTLDLNRRMGRNMSLGLRGSIDDRSYQSSGQRDRDTQASVSLRKGFGLKLAANLEIVHFSRGGEGNDHYTENAIRAAVQYTFGAGR